ncbi:hypothetical protein OA85_13640 [Flavobacterium sp. AED]|nr:hypothetical protein OA85_13640 [Flavobacterium sp. AED]
MVKYYDIQKTHNAFIFLFNGVLLSDFILKDEVIRRVILNDYFEFFCSDLGVILSKKILNLKFIFCDFTELQTLQFQLCT